MTILGTVEFCLLIKVRAGWLIESHADFFTDAFLLFTDGCKLKTFPFLTRLCPHAMFVI